MSKKVKTIYSDGEKQKETQQPKKPGIIKTGAEKPKVKITGPGAKVVASVLLLLAMVGSLFAQPGILPQPGTQASVFTNRLLTTLNASGTTNRLYFTNASAAFGATNGTHIKSNSTAGRWEWLTNYTSVVATNVNNRSTGVWTRVLAGAATYGQTRYDPRSPQTLPDAPASTAPNPSFALVQEDGSITNDTTGNAATATTATTAGSANTASALITNSYVVARIHAPSLGFNGTTHGPNVVIGSTNSGVFGSESHSCVVLGGGDVGYNNYITNGEWSVIGGGYGHIIVGGDGGGGNCVIAGGELNGIYGNFHLGGYASFSTISGGEINLIGNTDGTSFVTHNTIAGGRRSKIIGSSASYNFIGGGGDDSDNDIGLTIRNSNKSAVLGGAYNWIEGSIAMAIGWDLRITNENKTVFVGAGNNAMQVYSNGNVVVAGNIVGSGASLTNLPFTQYSYSEVGPATPQIFTGGGAYDKITLNYTNANQGGLFSMTNSRVVALQAGTFKVRASVLGTVTGYFKARLRRVSGTPATLLNGQIVYLDPLLTLMGASEVSGLITVAAGDVFELQARSDEATGTAGFTGDTDSELQMLSFITLEKQ